MGESPRAYIAAGKAESKAAESKAAESKAAYEKLWEERRKWVST